MKNSLFVVLLLVSAQLSAQRYTDTFDPNDEEVKSLLGKGNEVNGFGGVDLKVGQMQDQRALVVGAHGGVLINRKYLLGLAGYGIATNVTFDGITADQTASELTLHGGYGGVLLGGIVASKRVFHLVIPVVFGAGSLEVSDEDFFTARPNDAEFTVENSAFFVVEPGAQLEINLTRNLRLAAGGSYRFITGLQMDNVRQEEVSGWNLLVSLRIGRY